MTQRDYEADAIKLAAVITAAPRWVGALLEAEGVPVPPDWLPLWRVATALLSLGMAFAEAFAINYVFNAWRNQKDRKANKLLLLAIISLVCFTLVLAPYIAANVRGLKLADVLGDAVLWWAWSAAVAASTFVVVASVGYAQKQDTGEHVAKVAKSDNAKVMPLATYEDFQALMATGNGSAPKSVKDLASQYNVKTRTAYRWWQRYHA